MVIRLSSPRSRGVTLPEMLVAMVIMTLVMAALFVLYYTSLQVWRRCSSQSQADPPAHISVGRLSRELRNASAVNGITDSSLTFTLPLKDADGYNVVPLAPAEVISYYVGDADGNREPTGTSLWRERTRLSSGATSRQLIAGNVERLAFDVDATESRVLKIYAISVTVIGREGRHEYRSQFGSHVALRN